MRLSLREITLVSAMLLAPIPLFAGERPSRVVSLNVCTDQLAILLAEPSQLISVSFLASDPKSSMLYKEALAFPRNRGQAEEIFPMKPDLILAGTYTTRSTVSMLQRLGFHVEEFAPERSIQDIRDNITRMGKLLGTEQKADAILSDMDRRISKIQAPKGDAPLGAFYYSNSYTSGTGTIISDIARLAGIRNLGDEKALYGTAYLSLEQLVLSTPDLIVANEIMEDKPALAQQNFLHPAYRKLLSKVKTISIDGRRTACGGPFTIDAVEQLNAAARKFGEMRLK